MMMVVVLVVVVVVVDDDNTHTHEVLMCCVFDYCTIQSEQAKLILNSETQFKKNKSNWFEFVNKEHKNCFVVVAVNVIFHVLLYYVDYYYCGYGFF